MKLIVIKYFKKLKGIIVQHKYFLLVLLFSLIFRIVKLTDFKIHKDSYKFLLIARAASKFKFVSGFYSNYEDFQSLTFFSPDKWLFGYLVGFVSKGVSLVGSDLNNNLIEIVAHVLVIVFSLSTLCLIYSIVLKITKSKSAAALSALIFGLSGAQIFWSGFIITDTLAALLLLFYLYLRNLDLGRAVRKNQKITICHSELDSESRIHHTCVSHGILKEASLPNRWIRDESSRTVCWLSQFFYIGLSLIFIILLYLTRPEFLILSFFIELVFVFIEWSKKKKVNWLKYFWLGLPGFVFFNQRLFRLGLAWFLFGWVLMMFIIVFFLVWNTKYKTKKTRVFSFVFGIIAVCWLMVLLFNFLFSNIFQGFFWGDVFLWFAVFVLAGFFAFNFNKIKFTFIQKAYLLEIFVLTAVLLLIYYYFNPLIARYFVIILPFICILVGIFVSRIQIKFSKKSYFLFFFFLGMIILTQIVYVMRFEKFSGQDYQAEVAQQVITKAKEYECRKLYVGQEEAFYWYDELAEFEIKALDQNLSNLPEEPHFFVDTPYIEAIGLTQDSLGLNLVIDADTEALYRLDNKEYKGWFRLLTSCEK